MDCPIRPEDLMSDIEPLALSAPSSAPASPSTTRAGPTFDRSVASTVARSLPTSPCTTLASSSKVTARLYTSLKSSRELEVRHGPELQPWPAFGEGGTEVPAGACWESSGKRLVRARSARDGPRPDSALASSSLKQPAASEQGEVAERGHTPCPRQLRADGPGSGIPGSWPLIQSQDCTPVTKSTAAAAPEIADSRHHGLARLAKDAGSAGRLAPLDMEELAVEMTQKLSKRVEGSTGLKAGSRHISEMESVRSHLQNMLKFSQDLTDRNDAISPADEQRRDNDSFESDCTSSLLSAKPFQEMSVSPPAPILGLDEAALFPRYSRMRLGAGPAAESSLFEYQILKDTLDKERTRRKHCEKQIQVLQNKILELQQQLAVAVSADRKKDIMIEQLDKTLVKVVEGWKKHDGERSEAIRQLQEEHEAVERERGERQQALLNFEHHLSQATQALAKEQQEKGLLEKERGLLEDEVRKLHQDLQTEQQRCLRLQAKWDEAESGRLRERKQAEALRAQLAQERGACDQREKQLEQRSTQREEQLQKEIEKERAATQREAQRGQDAQQVLSAVQTEMQRLESELDAISHEKESLQMELSLVKARFESQRVKSETEFKVALEQQVTERLTAVHEDSIQQMAAAREQHRRQIMELTTQHEHEMGKQLAEFKLELQEREEKHRHVIEGYELRLSKGQEETGRLLAAKRKLEVQRNEMVSKLQTMMQSHWNEALKVLMSENLPHGLHRLQHPALHCDQFPVYQELNRSLSASGSQCSGAPVDCDLPSCSGLPYPAPASESDRPKLSSCGNLLTLVRTARGSDHRVQEMVPPHQACGDGIECGQLPESRGVSAWSSRNPSARFTWAVPLQPPMLVSQRLAPTATTGQVVDAQAGRNPAGAPETHFKANDSAERPPATASSQHGGRSQRPALPLLPDPRCVEDLSQLLNYSFLSQASFQPLEPQVDETIAVPGPHAEELAEHPFTEAEVGGQTQDQQPSEGRAAPDSSLDSSGGQSFQDLSSRSSELQYYIQMLLDRSPSDHVDTSADSETPSVTLHDATQQAGCPVVPDHSGLWETARPQPMGQLSTTQSSKAPSSAVQKVKISPSEWVPMQWEVSHKSGLAGGVLSPKQVGELSRLLSVYNGTPDHPVPSMEELFTYLRDTQADRPMGPEGLASTAQRNQDQKLHPAAKKEGLSAQPSAQKRFTTNKPENRLTSGKEKRRPAHSSQGGGSKGSKTTIWR